MVDLFRPHPSLLFDQTSRLDSVPVHRISQVLTEVRGKVRTERAQLIDDSYWPMRSFCGSFPRSLILHGGYSD